MASSVIFSVGKPACCLRIVCSESGASSADFPRRWISSFSLEHLLVSEAGEFQRMHILLLFVLCGAD